MDERFVFGEDELRIDEYVFRLGSFASDAWKSAPEGCFLMFKPQPMLETFDRFFSSRADDSPLRTIFEIGVWDGGSTAFWFEYFRPEKLVAVDWLRREDSDYFRGYVDSRGIADRLKTYWGVDQGDAERLREIVDNEFAGPLDLVIDDGSHMLEETTTSFQTLFPLLRRGGLYVLEDWNWELNPDCRAPDHPFATRDGLVGLVADLARITGSSSTIRSMTIYRGFVAVERGPAPEGETFDLDEHLSGLPVKLGAESTGAGDAAA
jgi:predicted O-methyltransferase YrrM